MYSAIALDNSTVHDITESLPIRNVSGDIEKAIETDNLKSFDLKGGNKLYTNADSIIGFIDIINKIILAQDNLFALKSKPYNIVLIDRPDLDQTILGVAEKNYIVVEGDFAKDRYIKALSHELIHRYIGRAIEQDEENEIRYKWFFEGFTEFYGVKTLLDIEFINEDRYLRIVNDIMKNYFDSLIRNISFKKIDIKHLSDQCIGMLSYNKGFILAMIIDENLSRISNGKYSLRDVINKMMSNQIHFDLESFIEYLRLYLPEFFVEKFMSSIDDSSVLLTLLPQRLLNKNLTFKISNSYSGICLDLTKSIESQKIQGVELDCYNIGLRNDQELKCYSIDFGSGDIELKILEDQVPRTIKLKAKRVTNDIPIYEHLG